MFKTLIGGLTGLALMAFAWPVNASLILGTGQTGIFDFDLSGDSHAPPYDYVGFVLSFGGGDLLGADETIRIDVRAFRTAGGIWGPISSHHRPDNLRVYTAI